MLLQKYGHNLLCLSAAKQCALVQKLHAYGVKSTYSKPAHSFFAQSRGQTFQHFFGSLPCKGNGGDFAWRDTERFNEVCDACNERFCFAGTRACNNSGAAGGGLYGLLLLGIECFKCLRGVIRLSGSGLLFVYAFCTEFSAPGKPCKGQERCLTRDLFRFARLKEADDAVFAVISCLSDNFACPESADGFSGNRSCDLFDFFGSNGTKNVKFRTEFLEQFKIGKGDAGTQFPPLEKIL